MTRAQWETLTVAVTALCKRYRIKVTPRKVLSHVSHLAFCSIPSTLSTSTESRLQSFGICRIGCGGTQYCATLNAHADSFRKSYFAVGLYDHGVKCEDVP